MITIWAGGICLLFFVLNLAAIRSGQLALRAHDQNQATAKRWQDLEALWQPVLDRYLQHPDAAKVWQAVTSRETLYFIDYLMRYALKNQLPAGALAELAAPYLPRLSSRIHDLSLDAEQRARAVQTVSLLGQPKDIQDLSRCLEDPSPIVVFLAARALSESPDASSAKLILANLPRLLEWHLGFVVKLLVGMGPEIAVDLRVYLERNQRPETQRVCLQVLAQLEDQKALPLAVGLLSSSEDINVLVAALNLLGKLGQTEHLPLIRSCYDSPYFAVRLAVIRALHELRAADEQIFQQAFDDQSHWVALQAARALKATGSEHILHELSYVQHPRAALASQVLQTLEDLQDLESDVQKSEFSSQVGTLFQRLQAEPAEEVQLLISRLFFHPKTHPDVRYAMARELERFENYQFFYQTLSSFILGFKDQRSLIRALRSFANPEAVPALIEYYRKPQASLSEKIEIVEALGQVESVESLMFLSRVYNELFDQLNTSENLDPQLLQLQNCLATALAHKMI